MPSPPLSLSSQTLFSAAVLYILYHIVSSLGVVRRRRLARCLQNRHVWITGASQGIGLSLARVAVAHGARVSLTSRTAAPLRAAAALVGPPSVALAMPADVAGGASQDGSVDDKALSRAFGRIEKELGPVDIVIANAGVNQGARPFELLTDEELQQIVSTNLLGVMRTFACALPGMKLRKDGVLCAVGSLAGYRGLPGASVYGATKAGVSIFCESLGIELFGSGIAVVCVHPGFVETPAIENLKHPKPGLMSADQAAEIVLDAIVRRKRRLGFPWIMEHIVMRFAQLVPSPVYEVIMHLTGDHRRGFEGVAEKET